MILFLRVLIYAFKGWRRHFHYPVMFMRKGAAPLEDALAPMAMFDSSHGVGAGASGMAPTPPKIRTEFPETWIWDTLQDTGLVFPGLFWHGDHQIS